MKKNRLILATIVIVCLALAICLCACNKDSSEPTLLNFEGVSFSDLTVNYDGNEHTIEVVGLPEGVEVAYTANSATEVGEYHATATLSKEGYNTLTLNATLSIRANDFVGLTFENSTLEFDGAEHKLLLSGQVPEGAEVVYSTNAGTEVGEYRATVTISKHGYNTLTLSATLNITGQTFEGLTLANQSVEFDDTEHRLLVAGELPEGANVVYSHNAGTEVGTYNATATITKRGYYPLTLTATLTIRAKDFVGVSLVNVTTEYDGAAHSLVVTGIPEGANVSYQNNGKTDVGEYKISATISKRGYNTKTLSATLTISLPTAKGIVDARTRATESQIQNYDFVLNMTGAVNIAGYVGTADGNYVGEYRYNGELGEVKFARQTSGKLLPSSTEYIVTKGTAKVKVTENSDGEIKHVKVLNNDGEELMLINKPFEAIVNALSADNLSNIRKVQNSTYKFAADITLTADNPVIAKALAVLAKQGTNLSFKDISFTNPVSGMVLYFNFNDKSELDTFALEAEVAFPVKSIPVYIQLVYGQKNASSDITLPSIDGIILGSSDIAAELSIINGALDTLKTASDYSLDLVARNEFDPGWNIKATVDRYTARMYKHSYDIDGSPFVAFNHSYEYKTHHEEDGAETYKYTIGNITEDGSAHLVSRKGTNTITALDSVSVNTQFDYLTEGFRYSASDIDCITKETKDGVTTYKIYLKEAESILVNQKIAELINSNDAEGVIDVDNYFDSSDYMLRESCFTVVMNGSDLTTIDIETEFKYNPTSGDYTDKRITLTDKMTLEINKNIDKALAYTAPKSTTTKLGAYGLNNAKFYIL